MFPQTRMRRLRHSDGLRALARETTLSRDDMIYPLFVLPGENKKQEVSSLPGVFRYTADQLPGVASDIRSPAVLLFGVPDDDEKDETGSAALLEGGLVPRAVRAIKNARPDLVVITDLCLCAYTQHGHCGPLTEAGEVDNDRTLALLGQMARVHAAAGTDVVAPSGMMDGQVQAIRTDLDSADRESTGIMSYAVKYASSFYGPFRDAARSAPSFGDRSRYQLPPSNAREGIREGLLDEEEGADWLMVKPAMPYLDVLAELRRETRLPISAYQVSGEYAMIKSAAENGRIDEREVALESLLSIKRAGADAIITYYAEQACRWLEAG